MCAGRNGTGRSGDEIFRRERENGRSSRGRIDPSTDRERKDEHPTERREESHVHPRSRRRTFEDPSDRRGDQDREGERPPHDPPDGRHPEEREEGEREDRSPGDG